MVASPREQAREQTMRDIVRLGREQLAQIGPAGLSLRAVARDLGVVSSAVYRYVKSRDELLTLLVVDAYNELGDAVDGALAKVADGTPRERHFAVGRAVRHWALAEPARFGLIFGTPVPGYAAPADVTNEPGTRVIVALLGILEQAHRAGQLEASALAALPQSLRVDLDAIRAEYGLTVDAEHLAVAALVWTSMVGAVTFEVFDQFGSDTFTDPAALYEIHLALLAGLLGF
jgi:AcrR family transcriptional regulator